jgi:hypothetical protein
MLLTEAAILAELQPFGLGFFVFGRRIISTLALGASESDNVPHDSTLQRPSPFEKGRLKQVVTQ